MKEKQNITNAELDEILQDPNATREDRIGALFQNREVLDMLEKSKRKADESPATTKQQPGGKRASA